VTATKMMLTVHRPTVVDVRNLQEVAMVMITIEAEIMIAIKDHAEMMTTMVLARLREDTAEDRQVVVVVAFRRTMGRVVIPTMANVAREDHVVLSRRMILRLMSLIEPDQKVS
jgi:hypothetical protein